MSSRSSRAQSQQQQRAASINPGVPSNTASTSKMRPGSGMTSQQISSGVQSGSRSEPVRPRLSSPAPSTIYPDDSASLQPSQAGSDRGSRRSDRQYNIPNYAPMTAQTPQAIPQAAPYLASGSTSGGSQNQYTPPSIRSTARGSNVGDYEPLPALSGSNVPSNSRGMAAPSTARSRNQTPSSIAQSTPRGSATRSGAGMSTGAIGQNRTFAPTASQPLNPSGAQLSPGMNIGVPPAAQVHLHYNQVDNRQLHVHNNAPGRMITNNNQAYTTDNSNHHNTHAPQANTYNTHANNVGNTHGGVSQQAMGARTSAQLSSNGRQQGHLAPSESILLRGKQYKSVKKVSFNDWTDRRSVTYKDVPDDRPC